LTLIFNFAEVSKNVLQGENYRIKILELQYDSVNCDSVSNRIQEPSSNGPGLKCLEVPGWGVGESHHN